MKFSYSEKVINSSIKLGAIFTGFGLLLIITFLISRFTAVIAAIFGVPITIFAIPMLLSGFNRKITNYEIDHNGLNISNINGIKTLIKWRDITKVNDTPGTVVIYTARGKEVIYKDIENIDELYSQIVRHISSGVLKSKAQQPKKSKKENKTIEIDKQETVEEKPVEKKTSESRKLLEQLLTSSNSDRPAQPKVIEIDKQELQNGADQLLQSPKKFDTVNDDEKLNEASTEEKIPQEVLLPQTPADITGQEGEDSTPPPPASGKKSKLISAFLTGAMGSPKLSKQTLVITESAIASIAAKNPEERKSELLSKYKKHLPENQEEKVSLSSLLKNEEKEQQENDKNNIFKTLSENISVRANDAAVNGHDNPFSGVADDEQAKYHSVFPAFDRNITTVDVPANDYQAANIDVIPLGKNLSGKSERLEKLFSEPETVQTEMDKPVGSTRILSIDLLNPLKKKADPPAAEPAVQPEIQTNEPRHEIFAGPDSRVGTAPNLDDLLSKVGSTGKLPKFDSGTLKNMIKMDSGKLSPKDSVKTDTNNDSEEDSEEFSTTRRLRREALSEETRKKMELHVSIGDSVIGGQKDKEEEEKPMVLSSLDQEKKEAAAPGLDDLLTKLSNTGKLSLPKSGALRKEITRHSKTEAPKQEQLSDGSPSEMLSVYQMGFNDKKTPEPKTSQDSGLFQKEQSIPELGQLLNNFEQKTGKLSMGRPKPKATDEDVIKAQSSLFDRN